VFFFRNIKLTGSSIFFLEFFDRRSNLFHALCNAIRDVCLSRFVVPFFGLSNMELGHDCLCLFGVFSLLSEAVVQKNIASACTDVGNTVSAFV